MTQDEIDAKATDRLIFFSDAVVAIAITLLALELPIPQGVTNADALHFVYDNLGDYLAFFISFAVISVQWFGHHRVFRYVRSIPPPARGWNMMWLLMIVLTPFAMRVLNGDDAFQFRFVLYASVGALAGVFFLLAVHALDRAGAFDPITPAGLVVNSYDRLIAVSATFLVSIPVAFFTQWAYLCWFLIPVAGRLFRLIRHRPGRTKPVARA